MPFVKIPELNMHYETGGYGKAVLLFVHGNFASWRWWLPILKDTPQGYRVYAPDMRGCGESDQPDDGYTICQHADDLDQFIQALNLPRVHLVGHSLGGCVALEYALKHQKRIKTLTLVAPAPAEGQTVLNPSNRRNSFLTDASAMHSAFRLSESLGNKRNMLKRTFTRMMDPDVIEVDFNTLVDDAVKMSRDAAVDHIQTLNSWDVRDALGDLNLPVLIIGGRNDRLIPPESLQKVANMLPNGRLIIWPRMGHAPQLEQPERFIKILLKFTGQNSFPIAAGMRKKMIQFVSRLSNAYAQDYYLLYD